MNLGSLIRECEARTGMNDTEFQERWRRYINGAIRDFHRKFPWPGLEREITVTLRSGNRYLTLPHYVDHVSSILNTTDRVPIRKRGNWVNQDPAVYSNLTTGRPLEYQEAGHVASQGDPVGFCWLKSSHTSDLETVYVTGFAAASGSSDPAFDSLFLSESVALSGTSPVTLANQYATFHSISKATNTNGDLFLFDAGNSGRYISAIPASEVDARFRRLEFLFVPDSDRSLRIRYIPRLPHLVHDVESPHPAVEPDYIIEKAVAYWNRYEAQYQKGAFHDQQAADVLHSEANKEQNFGEWWSQIQPEVPGWNDPESDMYRGGY